MKRLFFAVFCAWPMWVFSAPQIVVSENFICAELDDGRLDCLVFDAHGQVLMRTACKYLDDDSVVCGEDATAAPALPPGRKWGA